MTDPAPGPPDLTRLTRKIRGPLGVIAVANVGLFLLAVFYTLYVGKGNVVTPAILGRELTLNPVMIFLWLIFWSWIWGVPGALLAVPLLAMTKIVADNIEILRPLGAFLGR